MCCFIGQKPEILDVSEDDPIIAWREFSIGWSYRVSSPMRLFYWHKPKYKIRTNPKPKGTSGFYARLRAQDIRTRLSGYRAKVALSGRVLKYEADREGYQHGGYRAERCEIIAIYIPYHTSKSWITAFREKNPAYKGVKIIRSKP